MKKVLLMLAFVLMVAGAYAQSTAKATPKTATADTTKPATAKATTTATVPAQTLKIATSKEVEQAPDVILAKGNYFTGEVLVVNQSKIFLTTQDNIFVWLKDGKAVEIKMIKPSVYTGMIMANGHKVYDQWPMVMRIGKEDFLVYYFATSGGGYYGLPNGTIQKEKKMKQSGVIRSQWLTDKEGVKEISSLKQLIEEMDKAATDY